MTRVLIFVIQNRRYIAMGLRVLLAFCINHQQTAALAGHAVPSTTSKKRRTLGN
jgi:hypothetical protein